MRKFRTNPNTSWSKVKEYINSQEIGFILKRQESIKNIKIPDSSVDGYFMRLTTIGVLEKSGRGMHTIKHHIPEIMNTIILFEVINIYRKIPWKQWVMPLEDQVKDAINNLTNNT